MNTVFKRLSFEALPIGFFHALSGSLLAWTEDQPSTAHSLAAYPPLSTPYPPYRPTALPPDPLLLLGQKDL